jgi:hypothetical protein
MKPWPLFNGITQSDNPAGSTDYHAAQLRIERRVRSAILIFNYTYSNWMDQTRFLNNGEFRDEKLWRGLNNADRRHYISWNTVVPLPFGKDGRFARNASGFVGVLINDWQLTSSLLWGSGTPLAIPAANFTCDSYIPKGGQAPEHWINNDLSCYRNLLAWEPRTTPINVGYLRNPGFVNWNPAFHKRFALPFEDMSLQFRMEAVNGLNHPNYGAPNGDISQRPSFTQWVGWSGFGTLPLGQDGTSRAVIASLKLIF